MIYKIESDGEEPVPSPDIERGDKLVFSVASVAEQRRLDGDFDLIVALRPIAYEESL